jgi:hypothetical protein
MQILHRRDEVRQRAAEPIHRPDHDHIEFSPRRTRLLYLFQMAAANASARGQRVAILSSQLSQLTGFCLSVDCLTPGCRGERAFAIGDLARIYGPSVTVGEVLRRMKCGFGCDGAVGAAWLTTGPVLSTRVRPASGAAPWAGGAGLGSQPPCVSTDRTGSLH